MFLSIGSDCAQHTLPTAPQTVEEVALVVAGWVEVQGATVQVSDGPNPEMDACLCMYYNLVDAACGDSTSIYLLKALSMTCC